MISEEMKHLRGENMTQIQVLNDELKILSDTKLKNEEDLLDELKHVLCFTIAIYKMRFEKIRKTKLTELDEAILNKKIQDLILMIPVDEMKGLVKIVYDSQE
ncbi:hypothetical protein [Clostridium sp. OM05-9]|uniref:hypothetical protein n=1 Tax=Clostridium sp. OM05-9 TaxID=2293045 RepID=UPI0011C23940|nr:hypothetical protein [Clostridium sp. OM05-9]